MKSSPPGQAVNPAVVELQSLRLEMRQTKEELAGLRADFRKLNIIDQVAKGVLLAGFALWIGVLVLSTIAQILFGR
ncbi:MAG: hypothetical protein KME13_23915 [Myxacorys californica WJT36-NPBG1]|jgi:hypothetical protein|nr:hypothetical protein [Myxacorys californica WJT36-NPBG1]